MLEVEEMPPVSVAFACNNPDSGMFTGKFCKVEIGEEILSLDSKFWPPTGPKLSYDFEAQESRGFGAAKAMGRIKVSRRFFPIIGYKYGWGNWCWDLVLMEPETVIDLVNYLKSMNVFGVDAGESRWFNAWDDPDVTFDKNPATWIRMLEKWGHQRP